VLLRFISSRGASKSRSAATPMKGFVMTYQHPRAKLKELIERASVAAEINFKKGNQVAPQGFAIRENGSRFAFKPIPAAGNAETVTMIRRIFAQQRVVATCSLWPRLPKASNSFCFPRKTKPA
jgi:hypothetical protein